MQRHATVLVKHVIVTAASSRKCALVCEPQMCRFKARTQFIPLNAAHRPPLPLWQAVSQILYNVAIAVLAVHDF
jgi:hypothetical protein